MKFFDAHVHVHILNSDWSTCFSSLQRMGLSGFCALVIAEFPNDEAVIKKMVPTWFHPFVSLRGLRNDASFLQQVPQTNRFEIKTYIDTRYVTENIDAVVEKYHRLGFSGIKLLFVPETDTGMQIEGMRKAFGRNLRASEEVTAQLVDSATRRKMSVLFHVDLREYYDFTEDMLNSFSATNFNIAHLGFSRRMVSGLLYRHENCYSDISSLSPFMKKQPEAYLDFITRYQDRLLFGSDAIIANPEHIKDAKLTFQNVVADTTVCAKVMATNYLRFHQTDTPPCVDRKEM
ncbi:hypothetical protein DSCO28_15880 [Desulfosarcina ovata subsp. sediminis]|uniref:Amidohydrolase-related domain-containing protein n=1 Tax=Desulfosarcina ovata subsp. sediminis TaxID=885957 RepID=A0A5K7ZG12_9BACT|nr:amidohydrolase family protein [Desulfosarcina ovata]BBO81022.1 hypothetical protein DSCO28_15880 [Desulfosarcina ovata subsp. sediminis]